MKRFIKIIFAVIIAVAALNYLTCLRAARFVKKLPRGAGGGREKIFKWRHGNVSYRVFGKGRPLLFVHGAAPGQCARDWDGIARAAAKRRRVYIIDLLGFGYSDKPKTDYSVYLYSVLIKGFIKSVIKRKASVVAFGRGAAFVSAACATEPGLFEELLFINPEGNNRAPSAAKRTLKLVYKIPVMGTSLWLLNTTRAAFFLRDAKSRGAAWGETKLRRALARSGGDAARYLQRAEAAGFLDYDIDGFIRETAVKCRVVKSRGQSLREFDARGFVSDNRAFFKL